MNKNEANRLVNYIENAIDWLLKAKGEYNEENQIRAELNLNLAQAEIKHAWELSRQQSVLVNEKQLNYQPKKVFKMLPAVACLTLCGALGMIFWVKPFLSQQLDLTKSSQVKAGIIVTTTLPTKDELVDKNKAEPLAESKKMLIAEHVSGTKHLEKKELAAKVVVNNKMVGTNHIRKSSDLVEDVSKSDLKINSSKVVVSKVQSVKVATIDQKQTTSGHNQEKSTSVTTNLIESANEVRGKMSFDEDDLTKIATYSLCNGQ